MTQDRPIRVLHVIDRLARGGAETWLYHVAQQIDRQRFALDVMVHVDEPQPYDEPMRATGAWVLPCLEPARPWRYASNFHRIVREHGPYDIVHCHTHFWNGFVLRLAARASIPVRLPHSRVASTVQEQYGGAARALYRHVMRRLIHRYATRGFAVSRTAAAGLYGDDWQQDGRWSILRSAIDLAPFEQPPPVSDLPAALREHAGPVVAHVGRFHPQKNHDFLLRLFEHIARHDERAVLLLIGSGAEQNKMRAAVLANDVLRDRVFFLGDRTDVPSLLCHHVDLLMLPSLWEGLPRVALEAQAAGVPAVLSDAITEEATVLPELVRRLPLAEGASAWAAQALAMVQGPPPLSRDEALRRLRTSEFDIEQNIEKLQQIYAECVSRSTSAIASPP